jgi:hypothetical protein
MEESRILLVEAVGRTHTSINVPCFFYKSSPFSPPLSSPKKVLYRSLICKLLLEHFLKIWVKLSWQLFSPFFSNGRKHWGSWWVCSAEHGVYWLSWLAYKIPHLIPIPISFNILPAPLSLQPLLWPLASRDRPHLPRCTIHLLLSSSGLPTWWWLGEPM